MGASVFSRNGPQIVIYIRWIARAVCPIGRGIGIGLGRMFLKIVAVRFAGSGKVRFSGEVMFCLGLGSGGLCSLGTLEFLKTPLRV